MLWYLLIILGMVTSAGLLYYGFTKEDDGRPFRATHLVVGRHSLTESSRTQILIEGFFGLVLSALALAYKLLSA